MCYLLYVYNYYFSKILRYGENKHFVRTAHMKSDIGAYKLQST